MSRTRKEPVKSHSERLRIVFLHHYQKEVAPAVSFDEYYAEKMEKLIEYYKKLLNK